jgi:hypothetical protein
MPIIMAARSCSARHGFAHAQGGAYDKIRFMCNSLNKTLNGRSGRWLKHREAEARPSFFEKKEAKNF